MINNSTTTAAHRVVANTGFLYGSLIITLILGFFITRLVLSRLGSVDFGIYALVAGVVAMLSYLNASMSGVSLRFLAISLGRKDTLDLQRTFNSTFLVHLLLGVAILAIIEVGGLIMFRHFLNIPEDRLFDAKVVFQFMAVTTFVAIISVPYDALISAREDLKVLTFIRLLGVFGHLIVALIITWLPANALIAYGFLLFLNQNLIRLLLRSYCLKHYSECRLDLRKFADRILVKQLFAFSGWKTMDSGAAVLYVQVQAVLLNMFFGVALNAANGVAKQLSTQLNNFSASMLTAINPQIIRNEGAGDRRRMLALTTVAAKFSLFLFAIFSLPVLFEMHYILAVWLKEVPDYTVLFCQLLLIDLLISKYTFPINTAITAVGRIKAITITVLCNRVLQFMTTYLFFKAGSPPQTIFLISIAFGFIATAYKLYFGKIIVGLRIKEYLFAVFLKGTLPIGLSACALVLVRYSFEEGAVRLLLTAGTSTLALSVLIWSVGLTKSELLFCRALLSTARERLLGMMGYS